MDLMLSFSERSNGNCAQMAKALSSGNRSIVCLRALNVPACAGCQYAIRCYGMGGSFC